MSIAPGNKRAHGLALVLLLSAGCNDLPTSPVVDIGPDEPTTTDALALEVLAEATDDGRILFYRTTWRRDGTHVIELDDETTVPAAQTQRGQVWSVEVAAVDDELELGDPGTAEVTVRNSPPSAQVSIQPSPVSPYDDLVASVTTSDADGDPVELTLAWSVDSESQSDLDGEYTVPAGRTASEQTWTVSVIPYDGMDAGPPATAEVTIGADLRPEAFTFCAGGGRAINGSISGALCTSPLELATTPASNGKLLWQPGPIGAISP